MPTHPLGNVLADSALGRPPRAHLWIGALLGLAVAVWGCGGHTSAQSEPPTIETPGPPITTDRGQVFNATITTAGGELLVDKLEIEFNRRRGIHEFFGFYPNEYADYVRIPFRGLAKVEFLGEMPPQDFERARVGREQDKLEQNHAFKVRLTYRDQRQEDFYAIIPKLRGEKDLVLWEYGMSTKSNAVLYLEFDR